MIHFFRKIRFQLAEKNQFFKYSRYAIGEIVLVVIDHYKELDSIAKEIVDQTE